jgi:integrase
MSNGVIRRGNRYFYRRRVPLALQTIVGQKEVTKALGTGDRAEALRRAALMRVALDAEWDAKRRAAAAKPSNFDWMADLTMYAEERDAAAVEDGSNWSDEDERQKWLATLPVSEQIQIAVASALRDHSSPNPAHAGATVAAPVPTPQKPARSATRDTLASLAEAWGAERKPTKAARQLIARIVDRVYTVAGGVIAPTEVTRAHVLKLKDLLQAEGLAVSSINQNLRMLGTLLQFGVENDRATSNVATGVRISSRANTKESRLPFAVEHLNAIFACPIYRPENRSDKRKAAVPKGSAYRTNEELPASYWLPLLGLYTGARVEELGQLAPEDVYQEEGHWVIRITDEGAAQGVKTGSSRRRIPTHADLIALGFLEFVESRRGESRLWGLKPDSEGRETSAWGNWFALYLRDTIGIEDTRRVFHSFRHGFKDTLRGIGVAEEVSDALTGHASGRVGRRYGGLTYPLAPLVDAMSRYKVVGLNLPG